MLDKKCVAGHCYCCSEVIFEASPNEALGTQNERFFCEECFFLYLPL